MYKRLQFLSFPKPDKLERLALLAKNNAKKILLIGIIFLQLLYHVVGNIIIYNSYRPITFTDPVCSVYNQIQIDRYNWLSSVKVTVVSWTLGIFAVALMFEIVAVLWVLGGAVYLIFHCSKRCCCINNCKKCITRCCYTREIRINNLEEV